MRTLPSALAAHFGEDVTTLAVCWRVERRDGELILGTTHDDDLVVPFDAGVGLDLSGTYQSAVAISGSTVRSNSDMSADNLEVEGAVTTDLQLQDLTVADIEAGLLDDASITLFMVNWAAPADGQIVLRVGTIGAITRTSEGQYKTELRGLSQRLTQNIVRTYGTSCDAELGDTRCTVDLNALTVDGIVTTVVSNRVFAAELLSSSPPQPLDITLYLQMPRDIQVGDTFTIRPGCDKSAPTCKTIFSNFVNFRGHGLLVPGTGELAGFGGQTADKTYTGSLMERLIAEYVASFPWPSVIDSSGTPFYNGGLIRFTSGENDTFGMEVKYAVVET